MLRLNRISKTFNPGTVNEKRALKDLTLHIRQGGDFLVFENFSSFTTPSLG